MVNAKTLKEIGTELERLCAENRIPTRLVAKNIFDSECDVAIPADVANSCADELEAVRKGLLKMGCILEIYDRGAGRIIRGDDFRQFEITVKDGHWTHSEADERAEEESTEVPFDDDEKGNSWLIPLPEPDGSKNTEVFLTLCYEPYDWIDVGYMENGERKFKTEEFRAYNEYYSKKLLSHEIRTVRFQRGYGGPGRPIPKQMRFEVKYIKIWDQRHDIECDPRKPVKGIVPQYFVIGLGKRLKL